jgi:hypothetical protein
MDTQHYEVYAYLDPRKPGHYAYKDICFLFEPIYIGRGNMIQKRKFKHLKQSSNTHLKNLINLLSRQNQLPIIITIQEKLEFTQSQLVETDLIIQIGRCDVLTGPLYNLCDGGGGIPGIVMSDDQRKMRSLWMKKYFSKLTTEQRKAHGAKSLQNRTVEGKEHSKQRFKQFIESLTPEQKITIEQKRYENWCKSYYSRDLHQINETRQKCREASLRKSQYKICLHNATTKQTETLFLVEWLCRGLAKDGIMDRVRKNDFITPFKSKKNQNIYTLIYFNKVKPNETELIKLLEC